MKKIMLFIFCFLLTGCYDYQELNDLSIVSSIAIDYKEEEYIVNLEVIETTKEGSSTKLSSKLIHGSNSNLIEAFNNAMKNTNKKVYMEHIKLLVFSEDMAKKGILPIIDYVIRNTKISSNYRMVVTKDIDKLYNLEIENDIVSNLITDTINYGIEPTNTDNVDIIASYLVTNSKDISIPYVDIDDKSIVIDNVAVFKGDKLLYIDNNRMYEFVILDSNDINFENDGNVVNINKKDIKYEVKSNKIVITISGFGKVMQVNDNINLEIKDSYAVLEKLINSKIEDEVTLYLDNTIEKDIDLLGLKNIYYKNTKYKIIDIEYEVKVDIKINQNGGIYEVLHD